MSEKVFFGKHFIGMEINFSELESPKWIIVEKRPERHDQGDAFDFENFGGPSAAWAGFVCQNASDSSKKAIMKIFMQSVPPSLLLTIFPSTH
jgi:hypothetical protein